MIRSRPADLNTSPRTPERPSRRRTSGSESPLSPVSPGRQLASPQFSPLSVHSNDIVRDQPRSQIPGLERRDAGEKGERYVLGPRARTPRKAQPAPPNAAKLDDLAYRIHVGDGERRMDKAAEAACAHLKDGENPRFHWIKHGEIEDTPGSMGGYVWDIPVSMTHGPRRVRNPHRSADLEFDVFTEEQAGAACTRGITEIQDGIVREMEDTHFVEDVTFTAAGQEHRGVLQGVADGHSSDQQHGKEWSRHVEKELPKALAKRLSQFNQKSLDETDILNAFKIAVVDLTYGKAGKGGTTMNFSMVIGNTLYVANLGDSRAILVAPHEIVQLSEDADPGEPTYRKGLEKRDGSVYQDSSGHYRAELPRRPNHGYALSRAAGDHDMEGRMNCRPKVTRYRLPEKPEDRAGYYIVHCCDGMFEQGAASSEQVGWHVRERLYQGELPHRVAMEGVLSAMSAGSFDNVSMLIRHLGPQWPIDSPPRSTFSAPPSVQLSDVSEHSEEFPEEGEEASGEWLGEGFDVPVEFPDDAVQVPRILTRAESMLLDLQEKSQGADGPRQGQGPAE